MCQNIQFRFEKLKDILKRFSNFLLTQLRKIFRLIFKRKHKTLNRSFLVKSNSVLNFLINKLLIKL